MASTRIAILVGIFALAAAARDARAETLASVSERPFEHLFATEPPAPDSSELILTLPQDPAGTQPQTTEKPPLLKHTGFKALIFTTGADFKAFPRRKSTWVILGIGAAAAAIMLPWDDEITESLSDSGARKFFAPGRVIGYAYVQTGAAVATYIVGRYFIKPGEGKTNKISHIGFDLLRANIVTQAFTYGIKLAVRRDRPTGECCSFPSGHASVTFATASVLERHFGHRAAWPTFAIGGYVAMSRIFDNRHFASDVLFGSALGVAVGWTIVGRHGRDEYALVPVPVRGGMAIMFTRNPRRSN